MNLIEFVQNSIETILTPNLIQTIIEEEFKSYTQKNYEPLHSDNYIVECAILYIRNNYKEYFKKVNTIINEAIQNCNLTEEQEKYIRNKIKFDIKIDDNGKKICDIRIGD